MNRISIIGGSGTGKTVLSDNLGKILKLPVYHLDGLNYSSNWQEVDKSKRDKKFLNLIKKSKWIMDGTYRKTLKDRLKASDLIIYLDYSTFKQLKGVIGRYIKSGGKEKPEIPGCKERLNMKFLIWVLKWRKTKRKELIDALKEIDQDKILIFKNRRELNKWFYQEFGKKMEV